MSVASRVVGANAASVSGWVNADMRAAGEAPPVPIADALIAAPSE